MGEAIGEILPVAVGVALSPFPVIAVILMLFSARARSNSLAFMFGWMVAIVSACAIVIAIAGTQDLTSEGEPSAAVSWARIVVGALLLLLAVRQWKQRPSPGAEVAMPRWMSRIDAMKPAGAFGIGALLAAVNPKNLLLIVSAGVAIAGADLSSGDQAVVVGVFTLFAACTVAIPTLAFLVAGQRVQPILHELREWLVANNAAMMAVLLLVIGMSQLGKGIGGLA